MRQQILIILKQALLTICILLSFSIHSSTAQNRTPWQEIGDLQSPEWQWIITHPMSAKKAYHITKETLTRKQKWRKEKLLDGDHGGGELDALQHIYWMARLAQCIPYSSARKLGEAHEKSNKIIFFKNPEKLFLANDSISTKMDLLNNEVGIRLALSFPHSPSDSIEKYAIEAILKGEGYKIKKSSSGNFIDSIGNSYPPNYYIGRWRNNKQIIRSNE